MLISGLQIKTMKHKSDKTMHELGLYEPHHEKTCFCHMLPTKAQISLHIRSLISAFVIRCLDSIISVVSICKISSLHFVSIAEQTGLSLTWSKPLKTGFLNTRLKCDCPKKSIMVVCFQMKIPSLWKSVWHYSESLLIFKNAPHNHYRFFYCLFKS